MKQLPDGGAFSKPLPKGVGQSTLAVRGGLMRSGFEETAEALYLTSSFVFPDARSAEAALAGELDHYVYSRLRNPTVSMFEERIRLIEGAEACFATASGMSAVFTALGALVGAGDRLVSSRGLFGPCYLLCNEVLPRWGVETVFVDGDDLDQWEAALSVPTAAVFFETPANPMQSLVDVSQVSKIAHSAGATVVLDNALASPVLQRSLDLGADVVVYSGTKHIDGQGRVLGGVILGSQEYIEGPVLKLMRNTGPTLSPFNAWVMLKGIETMPLRVRHCSASALRIAEFLEQHPFVSSVRYPYLPSHPQYELAKRQMSAGGTVVTFELGGDDAQKRAFALIDALQVIDITGNLGDTKTLITHPATTTHRSMGPEARANAGITDGVIRISLGLEDVEDLLSDLDHALGICGA